MCGIIAVLVTFFVLWAPSVGCHAPVLQHSSKITSPDRDSSSINRVARSFPKTLRPGAYQAYAGTVIDLCDEGSISYFVVVYINLLACSPFRSVHTFLGQSTRNY